MGAATMSPDTELGDVQPGDEIPGWEMAFVDPARMRTMAAILRDPYTVHWDRDANAALGLGGRVINQGPLNLGYIVNMLLAWAGPSCVRRLTVSFGRPVLDGDPVVARGRVVSVADADGERRATCEVWLDRDGEHVVTGTAVVALAEAPITRNSEPSSR
jgi:acyl dehydratase